MLIRYLYTTYLSMGLFTLVANTAHADTLPLDSIKLPPGFSISLYADNVPGARSMALGEKGTLFVGTRDEGKVYALRDVNQDGKVDKVYVIAQGLNMPNGVAVRQGSLYIAEINRILRLDDIETRLPMPPKPVVVNANFSRNRHHGWKFIAFGPDDKLYIPVGAPCNVCESNNPTYAAITRMSPDGKNLEIVAQGVRNSVGFDWHPQTKTLWFTDNGRDWMGDDAPDDELNRLTKVGQHFGFPYCHAGDIQDPELGDDHLCKEFVPPILKLGAHVAPLGMRFYTGKMFPVEYHNQIFIAQHGSWNRSTPVGYRVMRVRLEGNNIKEYLPFAEGWLNEGQAWGRPVDVLVMPDGALLVSDDKAGVIYRIAYTK